MPGIEIYAAEASPPCRAIYMLGKILGVTFDVKTVEVLKGATRTPEFLKLNPQHQIPVINDNGFVLQESRAIMEYLVEAYGKDDTLLPKDVKAKAVVHSRLYFDAGTLYPRFTVTYLIPAIFGGEITENNLKSLNDSLQVLDTYLSTQKWAASDKLTLADIALVTTVSTIDAVGHDLTPFTNLNKWYAECKKSIAGYELNQAGADKLGALYRAKMAENKLKI